MGGLPLEQAIQYVAAAYIGLWLALLIYVVMLANKVGQLRREIKLLTDQVAKKG